MSIDYRELGSGEYCGLSIIEITSIPDRSILNDDNNQKDYYDFKRMLVEVSQIYKNNHSRNNSCEISVDLTWITSQVDNQPYKADIRMFFIIRAIHSDKTAIPSIIEQVKTVAEHHLKEQNFSIQSCDYSFFKSLYETTGRDDISLIVKEESVQDLQSPYFPFCYSFSRFVPTDIDMSHITNTLINYPNSFFSVQLMTTHYSIQEESIISQTVQMLQNISSVLGNPMNGMSNALADNASELYRCYETQRHMGLFNFNIIVGGNADSVSPIVASVFGFVSEGIEAGGSFSIVDVDALRGNIENNFFPLPWAINEYQMYECRNNAIWNSGYISEEYYRLPYIITIEEASAFFRLPIGNDNVGAGLSVDKSKSTRKAFSDGIINSGDIKIGAIKNTSDEIGIRIDDLTKHALIVGSPGSGKTTFSVGLLDQLWKNFNIPFLVIEPAKNEYRAMIESIPELQVFTPGKDHISPLTLNPFLPPNNVRLSSYKTVIKSVFNAALSLTTPLDKLFEEAVNNCYSDFRWIDTYTSDDEGIVFNIDDFIKEFGKTFEKIGYVGEAQNIGRAGLVRFKSLVSLFDSYYSIPIEDMLTKPTVIELSAIENSEDKTLIILLILLSSLSYINANYEGKGSLKNVILIEEAHVLFDASSGGTQGPVGTVEAAQTLVKRLLAEARAYGVGMIIADQSPRKVTNDVVGLTDIKMTFRLVEDEDKRILADSISMDHTQKDRLSRLRPGEAFFFYNKLYEPEEVITPNYREDSGIEITISDEELSNKVSYWNDKKDKLRPYPECTVPYCCSDSCDYDRRVLSANIARRIFSKYFTGEERDLKRVQEVFGQISKLVQNELNSEPFSKELLLCVKVHLWRRIKYDTKIELSDQIIINSLKR